MQGVVVQLARCSVMRMRPCDILDMYSSSNVNVAFKRREEGTGEEETVLEIKKSVSPFCTCWPLQLLASRPAQRLHHVSGMTLIPE